MASNAYDEGFNACLDSEYANPYSENSNDFDDYERGRTQRIKRAPSYGSFSSGFDEPETGLKEDVLQKLQKASIPNPYAEAKGK
ncbi:hypothetical protein AB4343_01045 [Vibrio breoganii]|uniref:Uncharacterized protein n=1 Tax=Vibrio breoganii TaxID=553239 RepID=A0AAP8SYB0_9VIBR|nr:hypothetical protein [Vibrio breoganii]PMK62561.1 hypothetical protein BCT98_00905 [Vibrio breoganii]PMK80304.1 hypothetical protein BCT94_00670 [Vibrio breoganii]PMO92874.1 hypothetical protein BCS98_08865 [Vibrio breoganii]PMP16759.1 hypothetical protein BCS93_00635 [Vibrio breoganii]